MPRDRIKGVCVCVCLVMWNIETLKPQQPQAETEVRNENMLELLKSGEKTNEIGYIYQIRK